MSGEPLRRVPTGIAGLDTIFAGGLFQAGLTIIQGQPGTGKTILGNQLCYNHVRAGGRALYVTLLAETHSRMLQHMGSMQFFEPERIPKGVFYISAFPVLDSGGLRGLLKLLLEEVRRHGATFLVLDGLMNVELQADSEVSFKKFLHELQSQASLADCSMVLLTSSGGESLPPSVEHTLVDAVIEMRSRLYGWRAERDLEVLKRRGGEFIRGRHAFSITNAGIEVFPRVETLLSPQDQPPDPARVPSGIPILDGMLLGGIPLGSTTLLTGPAGSGKTTLALQFLSQCGPDQPGVLLTASESPAAVRAKAGALGLPADSLMNDGHIGLVWSPGTTGMLDEVAGRLLAEVERRGARRLVLDGVLGLVRLAPDPERVLHILAALRLGMRTRGVTTLLTAEQDGPDLPLPGMPDLSGVAENLVALRLRNRRGAMVRTIQVRKARDTAVDTRTHAFELGQGGLHLAPDPAERLRVAVILVADDEFGITEVLDTLLTGEGYRVQTAPDGRRALERLRGERPDVLLLDYMMPLLDGIGVMRAMQADPALARVPVVFMSSLSERAITEHVSGYAGFLRKPFRIHEVLSALLRVLPSPVDASP